MIGTYGRNSYGGRVGAKRNRKTHTISPKGGSVRLGKSVGSVRLGKSVGSSKKS